MSQWLRSIKCSGCWVTFTFPILFLIIKKSAGLGSERKGKKLAIILSPISSSQWEKVSKAQGSCSQGGAGPGCRSTPTAFPWSSCPRAAPLPASVWSYLSPPSLCLLSVARRWRAGKGVKTSPTIISYPVTDSTLKQKGNKFKQTTVKSPRWR